MRVHTLFGVFVALALAGGVRAQVVTTADDYLKRGDGHKAAYAYEKAIADYTKALELDKGLVAALKGRAQMYTYSGKYKEAAADYTSAIKASSLDVPSYLARGQVYGYLAKYDMAIADYTFALQWDPKNTDAYTYRAWAYSAQGKQDKAVADFDKLIEVSPTANSYSLRAGYYRYTNKDLKKAITDYTTLIGLEPTAAYRYAERASAYLENKDPDNAIADYTKAIELEPKGYYYMTARASAYVQKGRTDDAITDYTSALALYPTDAHTHLLRAEAEKRKGRADRATADFNKAIEFGPSYAGRVYLYQNKILPDILQYDSIKIIGDATKAIEQRPKDADAYIRRAAMYQQSWGAELTKAIEDYTTAMKLAPDQAAALHVCRGAAYQQVGRHASAVADYREALQLDPQMKLAEAMLNAGITTMSGYKSITTVESVRLDEEVFFVKTSVERITLPDGAKKTIKKTLTTRHEVTVADVRKFDVEVRASVKQKQESTSGQSSSSRTTDSTTVNGGGSLGLGFLSFGAGGGKGWESASETGYTSSTLTGWESEFGTSIRKGMESSRAFSSSVESSEEVGIEPIGKGKDQPILVIYQDKYRSGTAKLKINGVVDEVRFAFPVGKDITWEYAEKSKSDDKK